MDDVNIARALHLLAVVHWIGGLAFVTLVILPLALSRASAHEGTSLFERVERRFSAQVRISVPVAGATGLWMTYRLDLWDRILDPAYWWMAAMLGLWCLFMVMLFVVEPAVRADRAKERPGRPPEAILRRLLRVHQVLLVLTSLTILGAVLGVRGIAFF